MFSIYLTVWRCTATLSRNRFVFVRTIHRSRVFVAIPTSDAALLITGTCTILPLPKAPSTMVFVFALLVIGGSRVDTFG